MTDQIYLDFNASTPLAPEVAAAMRPYLEGFHGNPSSRHWAGASLGAAIAKARQQVANLLACHPNEIVFTSGGSESINHALKGVYFRHRHRGQHIITTEIEHPATIETCRFLERLGASVTYLPVDGLGLVDPNALRAAITDQTILVSVMHANNEVGTIQPIAEIAAITRDAGILLHCDAAQSVGKIRTHVDDLGVDLLSLAGHKLHAPNGVGALFIRRGVEIDSLIHGGGQESARRAGTESALLAVALGEACELARAAIGRRTVRGLRDWFWARLQERFGDAVVLNGHPEKRLPNTLNMSFVGHDGAAILARLEGVAATTGSACHEGRTSLSPVLAAMGLPEATARGAIRFSLGRTTTQAELERVLALLTESIDLETA